MKNFKQLWKKLDKTERRKMAIGLSISCHVSPRTIEGWIYTNHEPSDLAKEKIVEYIKENYDSKFTL